MNIASSSLVRTSLRHLSTYSRPAAATSRFAVSATGCRFQHTLRDKYEYVEVEKKEGGVGLIRLNRPKALNALCDDLFKDLLHAGQALDGDKDIGCLVLTGSTKAFAAGADISEMKDRTFDYAYQTVRMFMVHMQHPIDFFLHFFFVFVASHDDFRFFSGVSLCIFNFCKKRICLPGGANSQN